MVWLMLPVCARLPSAPRSRTVGDTSLNLGNDLKHFMHASKNYQRSLTPQGGISSFRCTCLKIPSLLASVVYLSRCLTAEKMEVSFRPRYGILLRNQTESQICKAPYCWHFSQTPQSHFGGVKKMKQDDVSAGFQQQNWFPLLMDAYTMWFSHKIWRRKG